MSDHIGMSWSFLWYFYE